MSSTGKTVGFDGSFYTTENISATSSFCIQNEPVMSMVKVGEYTTTNMQSSLVHILELDVDTNIHTTSMTASSINTSGPIISTDIIKSGGFYGNTGSITLTTTGVTIACSSINTYTLYIDCAVPNSFAVYIIHPRTSNVTLIAGTSGVLTNFIITTTPTTITLKSNTGTYTLSYNLVINNKQL
jgi:hypothetical protein